MNKVILTHLKDRIFFGLWENDKPAELAFYDEEPEIKLGDIILARVKDIVPHIRAAFVQLTPSQMAFLPLEQAPAGLRSGDELAVVTQPRVVNEPHAVTAQRLKFGEQLCALLFRGQIAGQSFRAAVILFLQRVCQCLQFAHTASYQENTRALRTVLRYSSFCHLFGKCFTEAG